MFFSNKPHTLNLVNLIYGKPKKLWVNKKEYIQSLIIEEQICTVTQLLQLLTNKILFFHTELHLETTNIKWTNISETVKQI